VLTDKNEINLKDLPLYNVGVENLTILPSGPVPPNPAELLELDKVDRILEMARKEYDIIYVDIPPILSVTDPIVVAKRTDAVVFIVMANVTAVKAATRAYSLLKSANINIIGTVLNKVEMAMSEYGYGYGRYKYEKYYEK
jgi:capsular exopolysaccharide synthesis family protein